ncbi:M56 family metallopeptidase [Pullulanibacillus sp. KACC 23026]|uniref:M56 family metallopeptidase n=1 Tax=Pullulanibacillus sp. KACC 23026 TaxID=3028315 RepID=UPI0023B160C5|nr:M56 family metallopeptidase [Pullulanibacillus sp. KACC 23026]WEG12136.1 M56 family metallopeptidase [Pullulanibacillus sp. KACC 23026]
MMWKKKSKMMFGTGVFIALIVWCQIAVYGIHLIFGLKFQADFFDFCIGLFERDSPCYLIVVFLLNSIMAYSILVLIVGMIEYAIQSTRMHAKIDSLKTIKWTKAVSEKYKVVGQSIAVINDDKMVAFTIGLRTPLIVLSTGLLNLLETQEVEAVILHEMSHKINHDSLKIFILRLIARTLWFVPMTKLLYTNFKILCELSADEYAIKTTGSELGLSTALLKMINNFKKRNRSLIFVHFSNEAVNYRLQHLINPDQSLQIRMDRETVFVSVLVILFGMVLVTIA